MYGEFTVICMRPGGIEHKQYFVSRNEAEHYLNECEDRDAFIWGKLFDGGDIPLASFGAEEGGDA